MKTYSRIVCDLFTIGLLVALLAACASAPPPPPDDRYLTKEQDEALREKCEPQGCVVVPAPLFQQLMNMLRQRSA